MPQVCNGVCGLLYTPFQLQTPGRKAVQVLLIQQELRELQRAFNARFKQVRSGMSNDGAAATVNLASARLKLG